MVPLVTLITPSHGDRWQTLNDWLGAHRDFWRPAPFTQPTPEWARHWPELARQVAGLSDDDCQRFEDDPPALARMLEPLLPSLAQMQKLIALPSLADDAQAQALTLAEVRARDMPGRKRLQSGAFGPPCGHCMGRLSTGAAVKGTWPARFLLSAITRSSVTNGIRRW